MVIPARGGWSDGYNIGGQTSGMEGSVQIGIGGSVGPDYAI